MHVTRLGRRLVRGLVLLTCASCAGDAGQGPSPECAELWSKPAASGFVEALVAATEAPYPVWPGYELDDGAFVLDAGDTEAGDSCLGVWRGGRALGYARLPVDPSLGTPLYGYLLPEAPARSAGAGFPEGRQPEELVAWLGNLDVERATILPVEVPDFPIELPPLVKTQLALHEGFHVEVQSPHWSGAEAHWPTWDRQPDRPAVQACYAATPAVEAAFADERESLAQMVEAMLDGRRADACRAGSEFLERRAGRYALLEGVEVSGSDGSPGTCAVAEAIMELEEGTADYASWTRLFDLGQAGREQLMRRYRAVQADAFYLTGAMQLHAIELMEPDEMGAVRERIATSATMDSGAIQGVFEESLERWCQ